jgi:hypothetical protein
VHDGLAERRMAEKHVGGLHVQHDGKTYGGRGIQNQPRCGAH